MINDDEDNDTIKYIFDWDDDTNITETDFFNNNTLANASHSWAIAGVYVLKVYAKDKNNATSNIVEHIVYIDSIIVGTIGYLTDDDGDGVYDTFHNDTTGIETDVELPDDKTYLMDNDGDDEWDYVFDPETERLTRYKKDEAETTDGSPMMLLLMIGTAIAVIVYLYKKDYF